MRELGTNLETFLNVPVAVTPHSLAGFNNQKQGMPFLRDASRSLLTGSDRTASYNLFCTTTDDYLYLIHLENLSFRHKKKL
ncbi:hypothetical protein VB713_28250 [Anabaena cylindrica UHCC 0172]|uniref:hypothetical protein n=1 Tax=Anabaena cylindrica TaxID=1165 RepID=UPI002B208422|nr:hypothetical protein [Anabaena cylindrica]MEA5554819.1 hypothetical protein [Anabaena cylindrica UHCC 0172]